MKNNRNNKKNLLGRFSPPSAMATTRHFITKKVLCRVDAGGPKQSRAVLDRPPRTSHVCITPPQLTRRYHLTGACEPNLNFE